MFDKKEFKDLPRKNALNYLRSKGLTVDKERRLVFLEISESQVILFGGWTDDDSFMYLSLPNSIILAPVPVMMSKQEFLNVDADEACLSFNKMGKENKTFYPEKDPFTIKQEKHAEERILSSTYKELIEVWRRSSRMLGENEEQYLKMFGVHFKYDKDSMKKHQEKVRLLRRILFRWKPWKHVGQNYKSYLLTLPPYYVERMVSLNLPYQNVEILLKKRVPLKDWDADENREFPAEWLEMMY